MTDLQLQAGQRRHVRLIICGAHRPLLHQLIRINMTQLKLQAKQRLVTASDFFDVDESVWEKAIAAVRHKYPSIVGDSEKDDRINWEVKRVAKEDLLEAVADITDIVAKTIGDPKPRVTKGMGIAQAHGFDWSIVADRGTLFICLTRGRGK